MKTSPNKRLVPTRNGEAPLLAAYARRAVCVGSRLTSIALKVLILMAVVWPAQNLTRILLVLSAIPLGSAVLIYVYVGSFLGGHLLLVSGALIVLGAMRPRAADNALLATREDARA